MIEICHQPNYFNFLGLMLSLSNTLMDFFNSEKLDRVSSCINIKLAETTDLDKWPSINIEFSFPETVKAIIKNDHLSGFVNYEILWLITFYDIHIFNLPIFQSNFQV